MRLRKQPEHRPPSPCGAHPHRVHQHRSCPQAIKMPWDIRWALADTIPKAMMPWLAWAATTPVLSPPRRAGIIF